MAIEVGGNKAYATLVGAAAELSAQGMSFVALIVITTTVFIPAVELACSVALLTIARWHGRSSSIGLLFRLRERLGPWSMVEILVLGALVAIVKLGSLASVVLGFGMWSLGAFIVIHAAAAHAFDARSIWGPFEAEP
jgi:paraquat-inducible protein A